MKRISIKTIITILIITLIILVIPKTTYSENYIIETGEVKQDNTLKEVENNIETIPTTDITLDKTNIVLEKGESTKLTATINPINATNRTIIYSSSDKTVASVEKIENEENHSDEIEVEEEIISEIAYSEGTDNIENNMKDSKEDNNEEILSVLADYEGVAIINVKGNNEGRAIITVKVNDEVYKTVEVEVKEENEPITQPINEKKSILETNIELNTMEVIYNEKEHTPEVIIKDEDKILKEGIDYTISYENNINVGKAKVKITGINNYKGNVTKIFTINKATYNMENVKFIDKIVEYNGKAQSIIATGVPEGVKVTYRGNNKVKVGEYIVTAKFRVGKNYNSIPDKTAKLTITKKSISKFKIEGIKDVTYSGKRIQQNIVVKDENKTLKKGTDYTVTYENNKNAGNAIIKITGKNNYKDTITKKFIIKKLTYNTKNLKFINKTVEYNGKAQSIIATGMPKGVRVTYKGNNKVNAGKYIVTAIFKGNTNYNAIPNKTAKLTITKKSILKFKIYGIKNFTYTGKKIMQNIVVKDGNKTLKKGTDYTISYENNKNAGNAKIKITGKNNYKDTITKKFIIYKQTYKTNNLKFINKTVEYNGKAQSIIATGVPKGVKVTYKGNNKVNTGEYTVTAIFKGNINYNSIPNKIAKLTITKKHISKLKIEGIKDATYSRTSKKTSIGGITSELVIEKPVTLNIVIKNGNTVLKENNDYRLEYENNQGIGSNARLIINGEGNYTGTITKKFRIVAVKADKIIVSGNKYRELPKGSYVQLKATVSPSNATYNTITWTSSNPKNVTVNNNGIIHIVGTGKAIITATQKENKLSAKYVVVGYVEPDIISLDKPNLTMNKGTTTELTVSYTAKDEVSSNEIKWTSSNPKIVSLANSTTLNKKATIIAKEKGTATITATHLHGKTAKCEIKVTENLNEKFIYVSTNGSDKNSGISESMPLKTIKEGIRRLLPGYTLIVNSGTYYENRLNLSKKGTSAKPIKIVAKGNVIIDGSKNTKILSIHDASNIIIDGITFKNLKGVSDVHGIEITPNVTDIIIKNCKFNNIVTTEPKKDYAGASAIYVEGSSTTAINNITIDNCNIYDVNAGYSEAISVDGNCTNIKISRVTVDYSKGFDGNIGICVCGYYNTCEDNKALDKPRHVRISNCKVSNCRSPYNQTAYGIYADGGEDIIIENNEVTNCQGGIEIGAEETNSLTNNVKVRYNTITNCAFGVQIGGYFDDEGKITGVVTNVEFDRNTLTNCGRSESAVITFSKAKNVIISNCKITYSKNVELKEYDHNWAKNIQWKNNTIIQK